MGNDIIRTVATIPGVKQIEGQLSVAAELKYGPYEKRLAVMGLPSNNKLFTPVDKDNKPVEIGASGNPQRCWGLSIFEIASPSTSLRAKGYLRSG